MPQPPVFVIQQVNASLCFLINTMGLKHVAAAPQQHSLDLSAPPTYTRFSPFLSLSSSLSDSTF
jgi:hypothetical protein